MSINNIRCIRIFCTKCIIYTHKINLLIKTIRSRSAHFCGGEECSMCGAFENNTAVPMDGISPLPMEIAAFQSRLMSAHTSTSEYARECCETGAAASGASRRYLPRPLSECLVCGVGAGRRGPLAAPLWPLLPLSLANNLPSESPVHQVVRPTPSYPYARRPSFSQSPFKWHPQSPYAPDCRFRPGQTQALSGTLMYSAVLQPCPTPRLLAGQAKATVAKANKRPLSDCVRTAIPYSPSSSFKAITTTLATTAELANRITPTVHVNKNGLLNKSETNQSLNSASTTQHITAL